MDGQPKREPARCLHATEAEAPKGRGAQRDEGRSPFWGKMIIIAGLMLPLAASARCGAGAQPENDADAEVTDVEGTDQDGPDADVAPPDAEVEEAADETSVDADVGEGADETSVDAPDAAEDAPGEIEGTDADSEGDAPGCTATITDEHVDEEPLPPVAGRAMTRRLHYQTTDTEGEGCETTGTETKMVLEEHSASPPLPDTPEGRADALKDGGWTPVFSDHDMRVVSLDPCLGTAEIIDSADVGVGMPDGAVSDGRFVIMWAGAGSLPDGSEYADVQIMDMGSPIDPPSSAQVGEGGQYPLANGNIFIPSGIYGVGTAASGARFEIIGPDVTEHCDGEVRAGPGGIYMRFEIAYPAGWNLRPESL